MCLLEHYKKDVAVVARFQNECFSEMLEDEYRLLAKNLKNDDSKDEASAKVNLCEV